MSKPIGTTLSFILIAFCGLILIIVLIFSSGIISRIIGLQNDLKRSLIEESLASSSSSLSQNSSQSLSQNLSSISGLTFSTPFDNQTSLPNLTVPEINNSNNSFLNIGNNILGIPSLSGPSPIPATGDNQYTVLILNHGNYTGSAILQPLAGSKYYQVELSISNNLDYTTEINPFIDMVLIDQNGKENIPAITGNGLNSQTINTIEGSLAPKSTKIGTVVFEIPANATSLTFKFEPSLGLSGAYQAKLL